MASVEIPKLTPRVKLSLRPMESADLDAVMIVEKRAYSFPWTRGVFRDCLSAQHQCWVGEVESRLVAHGVLTIAAGESHLLNVCVSRDYREQGFGRELVAHLISVARSGGAERIFLEVRPTNMVAANLYASMGFEEIGIRKNYYPASLGHEDAMVLALVL